MGMAIVQAIPVIPDRIDTGHLGKMKSLRRSIPAFLILLALSGCATTGKVSTDPVVIAEHTIIDAKITSDTFVHLEAINRDSLAQFPQIHTFAEYVRKNAPVYLKQAYDLKKAYADNSTPDNLVNLQAICNTLVTLVTQSQTYINQINSADTK